MKQYNWKPRPIPKRKAPNRNPWRDAVTDKLRLYLRKHPARTFQLLDKDGNPAQISPAARRAILRANPPPYRVQTRRINTNQKDSPLHIWVSYDPTHWERQ